MWNMSTEVQFHPATAHLWRYVVEFYFFGLKGPPCRGMPAFGAQTDSRCDRHPFEQNEEKKIQLTVIPVQSSSLNSEGTYSSRPDLGRLFPG